MDGTRGWIEPGLPVLQRPELRAEELAFLYAVSRRMRDPEDRNRLGARVQCVLSCAASRRPRPAHLSCRNGAAVSPLQQRPGRRAESPLHRQPCDLQSDAGAGLGLRGGGADKSVCVRARAVVAAKSPAMTLARDN